MSPQQVESEGRLDYSLKVDTWGLGVITYELIHDKMPFRLGQWIFLLSQTTVCTDKLFQNLAVTLQRTRSRTLRNVMYTRRQRSLSLHEARMLVCSYSSSVALASSPRPHKKCITRCLLSLTAAAGQKRALYSCWTLFASPPNIFQFIACFYPL